MMLPVENLKALMPSFLMVRLLSPVTPPLNRVTLALALVELLPKVNIPVVPDANTIGLLTSKATVVPMYTLALAVLLRVSPKVMIPVLAPKDRGAVPLSVPAKMVVPPV